MTFRSIDRFRELDIERLPVAQLRREVVALRDEVVREANEAQLQLGRLNQELTAAKTQAERARGELLSAQQEVAAVRERVRHVEAELVDAAELRALAEERARLAESKLGQVDLLEKRLVELEVAKTTLAAQLGARDKLIAELRETAPDERVKPVETGELFSRFAKALDEAAAAGAESGFDIDDVEIDVRGALGEEGGALVMGLDAKRQASSETATRLRFRLKRRAELRQVE
jgi:predicted  nucleic acid-binding Zn-ribbon protein